MHALSSCFVAISRAQKSATFAEIALRHREAQKLDGIEVLHAAANALGDVEQDVGLGGVGVAQQPHTDPIHDQIAAAEIPEGNGLRAGNPSSEAWTPAPAGGVQM